MNNPVSTSVNKPNVATLIAVIMPMLVWILNKFVLAVPLTEGEIALVTSGLTGAAAWVGVYFTNNAPAQSGD